MEQTDSERIWEEHGNDIIDAIIRAAANQGLQHADAEACDIDFELHMLKSASMNSWERKKFSPAWLTSCARNFVTNYRRRIEGNRSHELNYDELRPDCTYLDGSENAPEQDALKAQIRIELSSAMSPLTETQRAMLVMRYYERSSYADIGAVFDAAPDAARMTVNRALLIVKSHLERTGFDPEEAMRIATQMKTRSKR